MRVFSILIYSLLFVACGDRELSDNVREQLDSENLIYECKAFIETADADAESRGERFESLVYTNEDEECKSVLWYINDSLVVARENTRNLKTNEQHEISFYFKDAKLYLSQDIHDLSLGEQLNAKELIVIYENDKPIRAWSNSSQNGEFETENYKEATAKSYSPKRALDMFTHDNAFALHFEDFMETNGENYLLLNTGQKDNFITAVKITQMDNFLKTLAGNKTKYKNAAVRINHQPVNQGGWVFHHYVSGEFLR